MAEQICKQKILFYSKKNDEWVIKIKCLTKGRRKKIIENILQNKGAFPQEPFLFLHIVVLVSLFLLDEGKLSRQWLGQ